MSDPKPLGIAIIGCGMISEFQAQAINALPEARLAGFYSRTVAKAESLPEAGQALLDLAEVLNLRAYARTYVSRSRTASAELVESVGAASQAAGLPCGGGCLVRGGRLLAAFAGDASRRSEPLREAWFV